jgi:hypothetical protein
MPWGTTFILILSKASLSLINLLTGMKERGQRLMVLQIGEPTDGGIEHTIAWHNIRQPGDFSKISGETR